MILEDDIAVCCWFECVIFVNMFWEVLNSFKSDTVDRPDGQNTAIMSQLGQKSR